MLNRAVMFQNPFVSMRKQLAEEKPKCHECCRECISYEPGWCYAHDVPVRAEATCNEFLHWRTLPAEVSSAK